VRVPVSDGLVDATPHSLGFRMPAEWEHQEGVWLSWPKDQDTFPDLIAVEQAYIRIIGEISRYENVHLLVSNEDIAHYVSDIFRDERIKTEHLKLHQIDYADVWFRDYGPSFITRRRDSSLAMVDWTFNAWGNKYPGLLQDDRIPSVMNEELNIPRFIPGIVLEGGSIDVNGCGTVLTTEQCLLHPNRNPGLDQSRISWYLREYLGCCHVIWLKDGIVGDDTDGHVDDIARFVNNKTVLCALAEHPGDENYSSLMENYQILRRAANQDGTPLTVIPLPMPGEVWDDNRLPASYANFLVTNQVVLFPSFGDPNDEIAEKVLRLAFPEREVIEIDSRELVRGLGTIHCISQQQPESPKRELVR